MCSPILSILSHKKHPKVILAKGLNKREEFAKDERFELELRGCLKGLGATGFSKEIGQNKLRPHYYDGTVSNSSSFSTKQAEMLALA
jgi:hypothetical protein